MQQPNSFFFSKILYKNIYNISGAVIGKLNDLILEFDSERPAVKAIEVINGKSKSYLSSESLEIYSDSHENYSVKLNSESITVASTSDDDIFLARDLLDKQIVDINGRKLVRVNDVRMGRISGIWYLIAVDIGFRGLLRRLGMEYAVIWAARVLKVQFRNKLIIWDSVQPIATGTENLKLSTSMNRIKTLHAADIADIIEELDSLSRNALFSSLDDEKAAEVLEEVESDVQKSLLENLSDEKASDLLEIMPSDEAAYYIYVVNSKGQMLGVLSLIDLIAANPDSKLYDLMYPFVANVKDDEKIDDAMEIMQKYNLATIPVVDKRRELVGTISLNDLVYEYTRLRRVAL